MNVSVVFGFIFAIIVIITVLFFGIDQILDIVGLTNTAAIKKTIDQLQTTTNRVYNLAEGSTLEFDLSMPGNTKFCFIDPENPQANNDTDPIRRWEPDNIDLSLIRENKYNIWIETEGKSLGYSIDFLKPIENFCAKSGRELFFENRGLTVGVID